MKKSRQIERILDSFDFARVRDTMVNTGWTWSMSGGEYVPGDDELRNRARELLEQVRVKGGSMYASTGGFTAVRAKGVLFLFWGYHECGLKD